MPAAKIEITLDPDLLDRVDRLVAVRRFPDRSGAVQEALRDKLDRLDRGHPVRDRLDRELEMIDPAEERRIADGLPDDDPDARKASVDSVISLRGRLAKKYASHPESAVLVREDRDR